MMLIHLQEVSLSYLYITVNETYIESGECYHVNSEEWAMIGNLREVRVEKYLKIHPLAPYTMEFQHKY